MNCAVSSAFLNKYNDGEFARIANAVSRKCPSFDSTYVGFLHKAVLIFLSNFFTTTSRQERAGSLGSFMGLCAAFDSYTVVTIFQHKTTNLATFRKMYGIAADNIEEIDTEELRRIRDEYQEFGTYLVMLADVGKELMSAESLWT